MNIVNKVTLRQMKKNKRRTIVTILGVIISVAMLTAVATIAVSFIDLLKRDEIATNGNWHVKYENVNNEQAIAIERNELVETTFYTKELGYAAFEQSQNKYKPYMHIQAFNEQAFEQVPLQLSEGRFPQTEDEIVLSNEMMQQESSNYAIGEVITVTIGNRKLPSYGDKEKIDPSYQLEMNEEGEVIEELINEVEKEFTIVGSIDKPAWELAWAPSYTALTYVDERAIGEGNIDVSTVLKKVDRNTLKNIETFAENEQIDEFVINYDLLRYDGVIANDGLRNSLFSFVMIVMTIILIGSVSLIYNSFAISVAERSRYLGMLSSVGATKKQKRNSVFFEGAVIGLISIPVGIIAGLAGIGITFYFINSFLEGVLSTTEKLQLTVSPSSILVAILVSILTIFISTYIPARRASRISAIDAIRQSEDIKLSNKAVKTSKLIRTLFGMEAEIGLKNLKRNKRRYRATVFSIIVSLVLFLSVSYFIQDLKQSIGMTRDFAKYDLLLTLPEGEENDRTVQAIKAMDEVTETNVVREHIFMTELPIEQIAEQLEEYVGDNEESYPYNTNVYIMTDDPLQKYAEKIGVDFEQLKGSNQAIVIEKVQYADDIAGKYVETKAIDAKIGDLIPLSDYDYDNEQSVYVDEIEVAAFTNDLPLGVETSFLGSMTMIISEDTYERLEAKNTQAGQHQERTMYIKSTDPNETQKLIEELPNLKGAQRVLNLYQIKKRDEQMIIVLSIFSYGFIVLITLISIANILNTISTSIALRKREFAMLKSMGMTPKGFNRMVRYESLFYGVKALLYGMPASFLAMFGMYQALGNSFSYDFTVPWLEVVIAVVSVFIIVTIAMLYSTAKVKRENIIDALKQENI